MVSIGTALLLCLTVFFCWKRNQRLEYKYSRLARQQSIQPSSGFGSGDAIRHSKETSSECEMEMAAAESCALDDDEEEEEDDHQVSVTVPMKSFGLVNKIRSMTAYKVNFFY